MSKERKAQEQVQNPCPHKKWKIDSQNVGTCLQCGEVRQFPLEKGGEVVILKAGMLPKLKDAKARGFNPHERHVYYELNKEPIIADLLTRGRQATRKKWRIPTGASLNSLEKRWLTTEQRALVDSIPFGPALSTEKVKSENGRLPAFPEFSMSWDPPVQLKWLEIYDKLIDRIPENERQKA